MGMMRSLVLLPVFLAFLTLSVLPASKTVAQQAGSLVTFSREPLAIQSGDKLHKFSVELALNNRQHRQGLMFRRRMAADAGMLFVYRREESISMWMKNTYIPLDMLFIASDGKIRHVAERTVPMSEAVIGSGGPVVAVLELNAGTVSRLGLKPGDSVLSSALGTATGR
jgi:uncharacterized protein